MSKIIPIQGCVLFLLCVAIISVVSYLGQGWLYQHSKGTTQDADNVGSRAAVLPGSLTPTLAQLLVLSRDPGDWNWGISDATVLPGQNQVPEISDPRIREPIVGAEIHQCPCTENGPRCSKPSHRHTSVRTHT